MIIQIFLIIITLPLIFILLHTIIRIIRFFFKFPIPSFLVNLIDNPLRRKIHPPETTALRHGINPGMNVLEIGPGNGRYTFAAARIIGNKGRISTIDIEKRIINRLKQRIGNFFYYTLIFEKD